MSVLIEKISLGRLIVCQQDDYRIRTMEFYNQLGNYEHILKLNKERQNYMKQLQLSYMFIKITNE